MRVLLQLALILGICYAGDLIHDYTGIPVPGNILGMLILLLLLCLKIVKLDQIREVSDFFLKRLSFFFPLQSALCSSAMTLKASGHCYCSSAS